MNEELTKPRAKLNAVNTHVNVSPSLYSLFVSTGSIQLTMLHALIAIHNWLMLTQQIKIIFISNFIINCTDFVNIRHASIDLEPKNFEIGTSAMDED